ncbi:carboxyltransferase domain-containing protein [Bacillus sp. T3]|uniref:carboxyltransferase domain-containing protein n=1 Tax=Bacillus sp. T3 TaxID=467262 RepID=UPI002981F53B|nr:carboxyltransferase domain-containing protein [Bacillus sp. T3]
MPGGQTGIYPIDTPGGWQLIGQTPLALFKPNESSPSLLNAGDRIKFIPISYKQFIHWEDDHQ